MKKFFAAVCCTLLVAGTSFAQDATPVAAAAEAVQAVAAEAAQAVAPEATPAAVTEAAPAVSEVAPTAVPMESSVVEGTVVNAPMVSEFPMAPIQSDCGCSGTPVMSAPMVAAPVVSANPVVTVPASSSCGCGAAPAAPTCGCEAPAPTCCQPRERRQVVRTAVSSLRARRSACCCN